MRPVLGRKVIEGKEDFFIFLQTFAGLWKFGLVTGDELIVSCQSRFAGRRVLRHSFATHLRGCLKSPDSRQILSSMCSLQLPESWHEACTTFCELGIGRTFQTSS